MVFLVARCFVGVATGSGATVAAASAVAMGAGAGAAAGSTAWGQVEGNGREGACDKKPRSKDIKYLAWEQVKGAGEGRDVARARSLAWADTDRSAVAHYWNALGTHAVLISRDAIWQASQRQPRLTGYPTDKPYYTYIASGTVRHSTALERCILLTVLAFRVVRCFTGMATASGAAASVGAATCAAACWGHVKGACVLAGRVCVN